jgi:hypothetical protein
MLRPLPLLLLPLLLLAGCLYLDDRNDAPRVSLSITRNTVSLGQSVEIAYQARDDVDSEADLSLELQVRDERGATPDPCSYQQIAHSDTRSTSFTFYAVGTYRIGAVSRDQRGAVGTATPVEVAVVNAPPVFTSTKGIALLSDAGRCGIFAAGEPVILYLDGMIKDSDASLRNPQLGLSCPAVPQLAYGWRVTGAPNGATPQLTEWRGSCDPPTAANGPVLAVAGETTVVCLWTSGAAELENYGVQFFASDQTNPEIDSTTLTIEVAPDSPPCITLESPTADHFVVDRTRPQTLQVTGVEDDRDANSDNIHYVWSVWRKSDPSWHVVPDHPDGVYTVNPLDFNVGEELRVRVEVLDRTNLLATTCDPMADDCLVDSCTIPSTTMAPHTCRKWRTWVLEPR